MITIKHSGSFNRTEKFLSRAEKIRIKDILDRYGKEGVKALSDATPKDSGETADSWNYEIKITVYGYSLAWTNSNIVDGVSVVILLQYGHGTGTGGYVQGRDFINPAIKPIFDKISTSIREEVSKL